MLKIYATQMTGVLRKLVEKNEAAVEDGGRLLAQAAISDGNLFVYGFGDMQAVEFEALYSQNALPKAKPLVRDDEWAPTGAMDCVLLATFSGADEEAAAVAEKIRETGASVIGMSNLEKGQPNPFAEAVDVHVELCAGEPLIPLEDGKRIGLPSTAAALFAYHALYISLFDILDEQGLLNDL